MDPIFYPDKADYRRTFEEERDCIRRVVEASGSDLGPNFSPSDRFYDAWRRFPEDDASRRMGLIGADEFSRLFAASLRRAKAWVQDIIRDHLRDLATVLDPIDEVASGGTPNLVAWSRGELGILRPNGHATDDLQAICSIADRWGDDEDLIVEESLRELTLASKIRRLEAVDDWESVTRDMTHINELCSERLWVGRKVVLTVNYAVYKDGDKKGYVHPGVPITFGSNRSGVTWDSEARHRQVKCRVVRDGDTVWLVLTKSRPKDLEATILKEEETILEDGRQKCRVALDRRGIMHVLVAVGARGVWRVATPADCGTFGALAHARLWTDPLRLFDEHEPWKNPESSPDYVRVKMLGRFYRHSYRNSMLRVAPSVEHQIISIETLLSSLGAQTTLNHDLYRAGRIRRVLVPKLFDANFRHLGILPP